MQSFSSNVAESHVMEWETKTYVWSISDEHCVRFGSDQVSGLMPGFTDTA